MTKYDYNSSEPVHVSLSDLTQRQRFLLSESKVFCILPWIHIHTYPTGETYPCCLSEMTHSVGNSKDSTLKQIINEDDMCLLRSNMLSEQPSKVCGRCYEQEKSGFFSGRNSANKHHGHHIDRVNDRIFHDGKLSEFKMTYWDIRFSNLCNLKCRTCGDIFSSQWHNDQSEINMRSFWDNVRGDDWPIDPPRSKPDYGALQENIKIELADTFGNEIMKHIKHYKSPSLNTAGRYNGDMLEQVLEHIDDVEQIYFAGGEPLIMDEHYYILEELEKRKRFDVRLIYNTNFTRVNLKDRLVFDYWKKFDSVSVGASLDGMDKYAEYIRKGTKWADVVHNRKRMIEICPNVDFYISPALSALNALHIVDFHRDWVNKGFIKPQDLNITILQDPKHYRIDIFPDFYKDMIREKYKKHLEWLMPQDDLQRATNGFISAINYLDNNDNVGMDTFWKKTEQLDAIRDEHILDYIPEFNYFD